ncbi:hypothetical protein WICPIJ_001168 [Wickerhamomyces pijperi]|uniref:Exonuclease domain-containing protein n=1 Tax=Wickerhamomyces pijperi TaxID=599730 RepID=A0A9P8TR10_WICPI|nr:hypothetical protein WICPIJ_001168 [Wickerhamomyces pijperi]
MNEVNDDIPNDVSKLNIAAGAITSGTPSPRGSPAPTATNNTFTATAEANFPLLGTERPSSSKRRRSSAAAVNFRRPSVTGTTSPIRPPPLKKEKKRKSSTPSYEISEPKPPSCGSIKFATFQQYMLHALDIDVNAPQSIFKINHRKFLENIVVLVIPNLEINKLGYVENEDAIVVDEDKPPSNASATSAKQATIKCISEVKAVPELQFFNEQFKECILMRSPGSKDQIFPLTKALLTRQYTKTEKKKVRDELAKKKLVLPDLLLKYDEFIANGYPVHPEIKDIREVVALPDGWKDTFQFEHDGSHTFAMDCEMCQSANGKVLTRVSLINFNGEKVLDELVQPDEPITDYLTAYSGITEEMLQGVTTTLADIQEKILAIISKDDILIGHSLENDLNVLQIRHPRVIDTALVFEHPRGPPFKSSLKYLTKQYLNRVIQEGSHDSIIDSLSCLDLVKLKLVEGALLGKTIDGELVFNDLDRLNKSGVVIDYHRVQPGQDRYVQVSSDEESIDKVIELLPSKQLIIAHLKDFEHKRHQQSAESAEAEEKDSKERLLLQTLNQRLTKLYNELPANTLLHILTATRDQTELNELMTRKRTFNREYATKKFSEIESSWSSKDEDDLKVCVLKTRMGLLFGKVKGDSVAASSIQEGVIDPTKTLF